MITKRIIPCLDVKNGRVVKGVNFAGLQDLADPVEMARYYNAAGADELVFYDITASAEGRALFTDILRSALRRYQACGRQIYAVCQGRARKHRVGCAGLAAAGRPKRRGRAGGQFH